MVYTKRDVLLLMIVVLMLMMPVDRDGGCGDDGMTVKGIERSLFFPA